MSPFDTPEQHIHALGGRLEVPSEDRGRTDKEALPLECVALHPVGAANLPPRQWAYGKFLQFGQAAALGGVDGSGKGLMTVSMVLAMITGQPLLGEKIWRPGPVAIVSYEDDADEWHRRIAAACKYHRVDYRFVISNIRFLRRHRGKISFGAMGENGPVFPDGDAISAALRAEQTALLVIDPFNHAHGFADGNSNAMMAQVAGEIGRVAHDTMAAVLVLHHLRKGSIGSIDDLMGATSLRATFRATRILQRMTADEATALGIKDDAWRYSRVSGSKANYAPPADEATWFQIVSVGLGNADEVYPAGDECGVTVCWQPPALFDGLDGSTLDAIFKQIRLGPGQGEDYRPSRQAKQNWVGNAIMACTGKSVDQVSKIIKLWCDNGVLTVESYKNSRTRQTAERVVLNEAKVAAILQPLQGKV